MIRLIAMLFIASASLLTGFSASRNLGAVRDIMRAFSRLIADTDAHIKYRSADVQKISELLFRCDYGALNQFTSRLGGISEPADFYAAWNAAVSELPTGLTNEQKELIAEFGAQLGRSGKEGQESLCAYTAQKCSLLEKAASEKHAKLSGLYINLGVIGAVAAAILML